MSAGGDTPESRGRMLLEAAEIYGDRLDEHDRAISCLLSARAHLPDDLEITERLERAYLRQNKLGELTTLLDAKSRSERIGQVYFGRALGRRSRQVKSVAVLTELFRSDPRHVPAQRLARRPYSRVPIASPSSPMCCGSKRAPSRPTKRGWGLSPTLVLLEEQRGPPRARTSSRRHSSCSASRPVTSWPTKPS